MLADVDILKVDKEQVGVAKTEEIPDGILTTMLLPPCMIDPAPSI